MQTTIRQADVDAYVLRLFKEERAAATIKNIIMTQHCFYAFWEDGS